MITWSHAVTEHLLAHFLTSFSKTWSTNQNQWLTKQIFYNIQKLETNSCIKCNVPWDEQPLSSQYHHGERITDTVTIQETCQINKIKFKDAERFRISGFGCIIYGVKCFRNNFSKLLQNHFEKTLSFYHQNFLSSAGRDKRRRASYELITSDADVLSFTTRRRTAQSHSQSSGLRQIMFKSRNLA